MKKSQIQQIKEGRAMRERTYSGRVQPFGPKSNLSTKNAVDLSTVPSSSQEKYNGGRDVEDTNSDLRRDEPRG